MNAFVYLALMITIAACPSARADCDHPVASGFFPESLTAFSGELESVGRQPLPRICTALPADFGDGEESLVVAYSNGVGGAVRVLRRPGSTWTVGGTFDGDLAGTRPILQLLDVNADDRPEIVVAFRSPQWNFPHWILAWDGSSLSSLTPDTDASGWTDLLDPHFVDLDGDGKLEIIDGSGGKDQVYRLSGDGGYLACAGETPVANLYVGHEGKPKTITYMFDVSDPARDWELKVINGDASGSERASSAVVSLNGRVVVRPSDLNATIARFSVPVGLVGSNSLDVELRGQPDARVWVLITPADGVCP